MTAAGLAAVADTRAKARATRVRSVAIASESREALADSRNHRWLAVLRRAVRKVAQP